MKALILGGTGAIGTDLANLLAQQGWQVSVTSRTPHANAGNVSYIHGNAKDLPFLRQILRKNWDAIVDFMVYSTQAFQERAELLLQSTSQYIFLSSARVYASSNDPITEESPRLLDVCKDAEYLETDEYSLAKARQEDILTGGKSGKWTIVRPYITYGPARLQLGVLEKEEWLYRALQGRSIIVSAETNIRITTLTQGLDVARAIAALVGNKRALGEIYQITSSSSIAWRSVLDIYSETLTDWLGFPPKTLELEVQKFQSIFPRKYQILYDRLFDRVFDSNKIHACTGIGEFTNPKDGLRDALHQFLKSPHFLSINWPVEAKKDFLTGEIASPSEPASLKTYAKYLAYRYLQPLKHKLSRSK